MNNSMKLFSISHGPMYSNEVVIGTFVHQQANSLPRCILIAPSLKYNSCNTAKIEQNRNHNMITAEISRFMGENVHISAYVVCLGQFGRNDLAYLTAVWQ